MSLTPETGAGLSNADSFVSLTEATARHASLGNDAWAAAASDTVREQALRRATVYMEQAFRDRWLGVRISATQALSWPRYDVWLDGYDVASTSVPQAVKDACADLALRGLASDLAPDLTRGVVRKKVGPLETEYDRFSPQSTRFNAVNMALAPLLRGSAAMATLVRS